MNKIIQLNKTLNFIKLALLFLSVGSFVLAFFDRIDSKLLFVSSVILIIVSLSFAIIKTIVIKVYKSRQIMSEGDLMLLKASNTQTNAIFVSILVIFLLIWVYLFFKVLSQIRLPF